MKLLYYSLEEDKTSSLEKLLRASKLLPVRNKNQPNNRSSFPMWWIFYNSSQNFIFSLVLQIFFKSILGAFGYKNSFLSRVFLLKSRIEVSIQKRIFPKKLLRLENFDKNKRYACFNSLQLVPNFKPTFFKGATLLSMREFFLPKAFHQISKKFDVYLKKTDFSFFRVATFFNCIKPENHRKKDLILNSFQIKRINFFSESLSRTQALIGLISYQRSLYSDKVLVFLLKTGFSRINCFSNFKLSSKYLSGKVPQEKRFWEKKCYDWIEPFLSNFFRYGTKGLFFISMKNISYFEILPSKKKIPLRIILKISEKFQTFNNLTFSKQHSHETPRESKTTQPNIIPTIKKKHALLITKPRINHQVTKKLPIITKESFDFNHEQIGVIYLAQFEKIFREEQTNIWLNPFLVVCSDLMSGFLEMIRNSNSLHSINKNSKSVNKIYQKPRNKVFDFKAQKKQIQMLTESLAGYSLVCFLLQVKDRHNGNILLNRENRVIHIDFGFIFDFSPGNLKFEADSFKMSREFISWIGGKKTEIFETLRETFIRGFLSVRKNLGKFLEIARILINEKKDKKNIKYKIEKFQERFKIGHSDSFVIKFCINLFKESLESWKTLQYDKYQKITSGIK